MGGPRSWNVAPPTTMDAARELPIRRRTTVVVTGEDEVSRRRAAAVLRAAGVPVNIEPADPAQLPDIDAHSEPAVVIIVCDRKLTARAKAIRALRRHLPDTRVVIVGPADSRSGVRRALEAGADGFVFDHELDVALVPTVRAVLAGQVAVPHLLRHEVDRPTLSRREKEALGLVVMGLTNSEIASRLFLAESTVKCHLTSAFAKLGVRSRDEAVRLILDPTERLGLGILNISCDVSPVPETAA